MKQVLKWMAPATPVFAAKAAPTKMACDLGLRRTCGSGHAREAGNAVDGTGCARVRGRARSHSDRASLKTPCKTT
ncbi:hypothetical protein FCH83_27170 [Pseudomonas putida]|nr:hypothetical protein [Pseudomonas putida]NTZ04030.1 hypothetical protein [Pseudomonas putida]NTZ26316.1 hypothetical protein [Pseudomonas putida]NTZ58531.1 hypothetical protein [Pseudomonas putida]NTZ65947.1 hypothetical protein [Pseudomonas putida]